MTIDKAKNVINELIVYVEDLPYYLSDEVKEVIDFVLNELEQQTFINKPCISEVICHADKINVLNKLKSEIIEYLFINGFGLEYQNDVVCIIDKYIDEKKEGDQIEQTTSEKES